MKSLMSGLVGIVCAFSFQSLAGEISVTQAQLDKLAAQYYAHESSTLFHSTSLATPQQCEDGDEQAGSTCSESACKLIGAYNCDSISEIEAVGAACRGNRNGKCIESSCKLVGAYNCDSLSEIERVAASCRGNVNSQCVEVACNYMGAYNCDSITEVEQVGVACRSVKASCIESVCKQIGAYNCDSVSEIERVASSCRGS